MEYCQQKENKTRDVMNKKNNKTKSLNDYMLNITEYDTNIF